MDSGNSSPMHFFHTTTEKILRENFEVHESMSQIINVTFHMHYDTGTIQNMQEWNQHLCIQAAVNRSFRPHVADVMDVIVLTSCVCVTAKRTDLWTLILALRSWRSSGGILRSILKVKVMKLKNVPWDIPFTSDSLVDGPAKEEKTRFHSLQFQIDIVCESGCLCVCLTELLIFFLNVHHIN